MKGPCAPRMTQTDFYAFYRRHYAPRLKKIDMLLKTMEKPLSVSKAARVLRLSESEVRRLMASGGVQRLDKKGFLSVMANGGSDICRLYQRELTRGNKASYSPADVAYIYGLIESHVAQAFCDMGLTTLPARDMPRLLAQIAVFILS